MKLNSIKLHSINILLPKHGILLNGVLIPNLLNKSLASFYLINIDFFLLHTAHFDKRIDLPLLVFETHGFKFSLSFCTLNNIIALFYTWNFKLLLILSFCFIISSIPIILVSFMNLFLSILLLCFFNILIITFSFFLHNCCITFIANFIIY